MRKAYPTIFARRARFRRAVSKAGLPSASVGSSVAKGWMTIGNARLALPRPLACSLCASLRACSSSIHPAGAGERVSQRRSSPPRSGNAMGRFQSFPLSTHASSHRVLPANV